MLLAACGGDKPTSPENTPSVVQEFSGNNQQARAGSTLSTPLVVEVLDRTGEPVGGVTVAFAVTRGGGAVSPTSAVSNSSGQARTTFTLGSAAGAQTVTATVGDLPPITFTATASAGPATQIVVVSGPPASGAAGVPLSPSVVLRVVDAQGIGVPGVALTATPASASGTFTFDATTTNAAGEVGAVWVLGPRPSAQSVTISGPPNSGIASATLATAAVAGPAASIVIHHGSGQTGDMGDQLALPLQVQVLDAFGNLVPDQDVAFAVASGGGSVTPATATTDGNGFAMTAWTLGPQAGEQRVTATVSAANGTANVAFDAQALAPSSATLWTLDHRVVDAEYAASANVIVTVSANPSRLTIVDPEARTQQAIALAQVPLAVAVDPAGTHAAVSHDGWLSYVNLQTRTVERVYPVTSVGGDVVLAGNGFAYVFPRADQWVDARSIELATGTETPSPWPGPFAGARIRLHPSGEYLYSASNGLSPSDFEKYDLRSGTAALLYDSPYHGDYEFGGDVWISGDGTRLFARSGNVFRSSPVRAEDMTYAGRLDGVRSVQAVVHPNGSARIYVLGVDAPPPDYWSPDPVPASELRTYESQFLGYQGSVRLPKFRVPNATGGTTGYQAEGWFLFVNAAETRVYAVVRAPGASGLALDWGVAAFDVSELP